MAVLRTFKVGATVGTFMTLIRLLKLHNVE